MKKWLKQFFCAHIFNEYKRENLRRESRRQLGISIIGTTYWYTPAASYRECLKGYKKKIVEVEFL